MRSVDTILEDIKKYKDLCLLYEKLKKDVSDFSTQKGIEFCFHEHLTPKEFHHFINGNLSILRNELAKARDE